MSNEFEKAKQEIIELAQSIRMYSGLSKDVLIASIKQLQPPAPPKCSSCRHAEFAQDKSHQFCFNPRAGVMHGEFVDDEFGCIHHSQYDKDGEV